MNVINQLRRDSGCTQTEFARRTGTSQSTIAAYEANTKSPSLRTLSRLAHRLDRHIAFTVSKSLTREDERSLAYHRAIAGHLVAKPTEVVAHARNNLRRWACDNHGANELFDRWHRWLDLPVNDLLVLMLDPSMACREMRQVSPFAGILTAAERARILARFQKSYAA